MSRRSLFSTLALFLAASMPVVAKVTYFAENWENYTEGSIPAGPWYVDPHMPAGGLTVVSGAAYNGIYRNPLDKILLVNGPGFNGKDAGIQARLVPDGYELQATDANNLVWSYEASGQDAQHSEWYMAISLGDVHPPRLIDSWDHVNGVGIPLSAPIPVIAYCKPFVTPFPNHKGYYYFDGQVWSFFGYMDYDTPMWSAPTITLGTSSLFLNCNCQNKFPVGGVARKYLGNFDTISIYTLDAEYQEWTVIGDISVYGPNGGNLVSSLSVSPNATFVSIGPVGGPFAPASKTYTLTNITAFSMDWTATKAQNWLTVSPNAGTLAPGASIDVTASINANANPLVRGLFTDVVAFTDTTNGSTQNRNVELYVGQIDSFTEELNGANDLKNRSVMLTPDGSSDFYHACGVPTTHFPTPAAGGINLALSGENSTKVTLQQGVVSLYGTPYTEFYVNPNGYITFGGGDTLTTGLILDHFKKPRISGLFADLTPTTGQVTYKQLMDRVAVTYQNVVKVNTAEANSFQIEMFYDGRIRLTWLDVATKYGVVGLSKGLGVPTNFHSSDFTAYAACPSVGYLADFDHDGDVDQSDFGHIQTCLAALPGLIVDQACADADVDLDGSVGSADVLAFYACFGGPNVTPAPSCLGFGNP